MFVKYQLLTPYTLVLCFLVIPYTLSAEAFAKGLDSEAGSAGNIVEPIATDVPAEGKSQFEPEFVAVPFIFSTETLSTTFGGAGVVKHAGQAQASILGVGLYSSNDSWVGFLGVNNYQLPNLEQWLFSGEFYQASYKQGIYFVPEDPSQGGSGPNMSESSKTQRIVTEGDESFSKLHIKYVLPWGRGENGAARSLMSRSHSDNFSWDPRESGVTSIELTPFVKTQELLGYEGLPNRTQGLELTLDWDNRDNGKNSTQGGHTSLTFSRDFGSNDSSSDQRESWTIWEFEQSAFFSLGSNSWFPQQILALNFYLADTPTWDRNHSSSEGYKGPPSFAGVSLGGFEHLRGYTSREFVGRSAVLYSAEYRVQPEWQPLQDWPVFNLYDVPWWQWVVFAEAGQVANSFSASELHDDMKWAVGVGARFEVENVVIRAELAFGEDSNQFWVMVNQPF